MSRSKVVWGGLCLALAVVLAILNVALSPEKLMFMVGGVNMPYLPPIILGIVGVALLATAGQGDKGSEVASAPVLDPQKAALNKRLESIAWGLFLIMLGGFIFIPESVIKKGAWSLGVGAIMLGLNAVRYAYGLKMSGFTTFLGVVSLISGVVQLLSAQTFEGPVLLIVLGAYLVAKPWFERRQLFGKAEEA